jgi:SAM-dependent methyltransferase
LQRAFSFNLAFFPALLHESGMWKQEEALPMEQRQDSPSGNFALARQKQLLQHVMSRWPRRGRSILDAACGTGLFSEFLWENGFEVSCLAQSQSMLERAQARLGHKASYQVGCTGHLPFEDHAFDYVALLGAPEEPDDPLAALEEALRVAAKGVVLGFFNTCSLARLAQALPGGASKSIPHGRRLGPMALWRVLRRLSDLRRLRFGTVLLGPPCTWRKGGISSFCNTLRLPLPLGAYGALSVTLGPAFPLTALPLRLRKGGLKEASPHALRGDMRARQRSMSESIQ